jgi:hypothetical protein
MTVDHLDKHSFQDFRGLDLLEIGTVQTIFDFIRETFQKFSPAVKGSYGPACGFVERSYQAVFLVAVKMFPAGTVNGHGNPSLINRHSGFQKKN